MDYMQQALYNHGADNCHIRLKFVNFETHDNHISHETQGLSDKHLVVRRGKPFKLTLLFHGRMWNPCTDRLVLEVCLVALYDLLVHIEATQHRRSYSVGRFVLLCNPWLKDDPVYMPLDVHIEEYIKSDYGLVYMGTYANISKRPWSFGQYEPGVLEACLTLLQMSPQHINNSHKDYMLRADPVYLSRVICAMVNQNDDLGILEGRWQGSYKDGVKPTDWSGSADILQQWISSKCRPVHYGQCWVFASVLCTVMRVLGIPSRVVTIFNAAHDSDGNTTIEEYYTSTGEKLNLTQDSIWNFHVWVECWMRRSDLGAEFDGWQVVDPTPQERSAGVFRCGPCPVAAIQRHCFSAPYDTPFLYAAVDADVIQLIVKNGLVVGRAVHTEQVGQLICTKSIGSDRPENLTLTYKGIKRLQACSVRKQRSNKLFSLERREAFSTHGLPSFDLSRGAEFGAGGAVHCLEVSLHTEGVPILGESIRMCVTVTNQSSSPRALVEHVNAQLKEYNRNPQESFWKIHQEMHIQPWEVLTLHHIITYSEYEFILAGDGMVNVAVVIKDTRTGERVLAAQEFSISTPLITIEIKGGDSIQVKKEQSVQVTFTNQLNKTLMSAVLTVEGFGLMQEKQEARLGLLQPGKKIEKKVSIMATSPGTKLLVATLSHSNSSVIVSRSYQKVSITAERG
ncbi:protein-glutamine gamma-glutamyltransferase 5-like isoform X2 [Melanotaenia boesemani]|uniref:protein-glutamine gamma-glutamyltransferase 5-like isoform X2 n=1 Tax=Melanotaenia boesemani TaxID=1250792 RepID=UPI001C047116|nr:protein-glutamine gamma-glutamyltransferase 5-like isoform X2 [Melanotaenia boesemani]